MLAFFDPPTRAYNVVGFVAAVAGVALGGWALVIAYDQLRKTLTAARAAEAAARQATDRITKITSLVGVHRLTVQTGELLICVRAIDWGGAAIRSKDLRAGLAALSSADETKLVRPAKWAALLDATSRVQGQVAKLVSEPVANDALWRDCQATIRWLDAELHGLTCVAQRSDGG